MKKTERKISEPQEEHRPAILDLFRERPTLEQLRKIVDWNPNRYGQFLEAEECVISQLEERERELQQVAGHIRAATLDGNRAESQRWALTRTGILAEVEAFEQLRKELRYCAAPDKLADEIAQREWRRTKLQREIDNRTEEISLHYGRR